MKFTPKQSRSRFSGVDMTPLIDIVFQLLIFFLVTAQMAQTSRAQLELPKEKGEPEASRAPAGLTVNVLADGSVVVDGRTVSLDELDALVDDAVARAGGGDALKPLVRADRGADAARLNEVLSRLGARGVAAVRLATERGR